MRGFRLSRRTLLPELAAMLAVGALSYAAYLSIPGSSETFSGLGISARGTINSIDSSRRVLNINHEPVKALNSQAMTMDFGVAPNVDLSSLRVGSKIAFTMKRRDDDLYIIESIRPTM
jgi:Cu/Ag efflux protein CusF